MKSATAPTLAIHLPPGSRIVIRQTTQVINPIVGIEIERRVVTTEVRPLPAEVPIVSRSQPRGKAAAEALLELLQQDFRGTAPQEQPPTQARSEGGRTFAASPSVGRPAPAACKSPGQAPRGGPESLSTQEAASSVSAELDRSSGDGPSPSSAGKCNCPRCRFHRSAGGFTPAL